MSSTVLFYDTDNQDWFNWLSLGYSVLAASVSEYNNAFMPAESQCFADLFTAGNGAVPMLSLIEGRTTDKDWSRYTVAAVQLVLFTFHAITSCQSDI